MRRKPKRPPFKYPSTLPPRSTTGKVLVMHTFTGRVEERPAPPLDKEERKRFGLE